MESSLSFFTKWALKGNVQEALVLKINSDRTPALVTIATLALH